MSYSALEGRLTKKAHSKTSYTKAQVEELKQCFDPITGPLYFMTHFYYIQARNGNELYKPYKFQDKLTDAFHNYRYSIALISRQCGKTTTAVGYLLWYAMFYADRSILVAAHKGDQAKEVISRLQYAYEHVPDHIRCGTTGYARTYIEFDNGSRILSETTTEKTGRGKTIHLLYCLGGESIVKIRNKKTLIEEDISLEDLYMRLYDPEIIESI